MILYTLHGNGYIDIKNVDNHKDLKVYVNLTNRCPCACTFCLRQTKQMCEENTLWLKKEPTVEDVINEFEKYDINLFVEVIFCGFGEPMERVYDLIQIADYLKRKRPDLKTRVNTNGLGNLVHNEDITPLLKDRLDVVSISLNAPDEKEYYELTRSRFGIGSYNEMLKFASLAKQYVPTVVLTVVDIIGEEKIHKCQKICDHLGVTLRVRPFEE